MKSWLGVLCMLALGWALAPAGSAIASEAPERALCIVCAMGGETELEKVEAAREYQGKPYYFCSKNCAKQFEIDPAAYLFEPGPAPAGLSLPALAGDEQLALTAKTGRVLLLDFWATSCKPCVKAMPEIDALYRDFRERGLDVVGVAIEGDKDPEKKVRKFIDKHAVTYPIAVDRKSVSASRKFGVRVLPTLFLIDTDGTIVERWSGVVDIDDVRRSVEALLAQPPGQRG